MKILVVEDNPGDVALLEEYLLNAGLGRYELSSAETLGEARETLRERSPDLIFLDLGLPDAQGPEVVSQVREQAGSVPIIVITGQGDRSLEERCFRAGAQQFHHKDDLSQEELTRSLRQVRPPNGAPAAAGATAVAGPATARRRQASEEGWTLGV